jgi:hypothetical protein
LPNRAFFNVDESGKISEHDLREAAASQIATDGARIYVMRPSDPVRVLAFNANGELSKTYKIAAPERGYRPLAIYASGGRIAIPFLESRSETVGGQTVRHLGPKSITRIVDQQSGTNLIDYVSPPGIDGACDCYVAPTQFLMLNDGDDGRFRLVTLSE